MYLLDHPIVLFVVVTLLLLLAHEVGYRLRALAKQRDDKDWEREVHQTRNQIAVLLSLLIGFAMSMAVSRFDLRKELVIEESNAIGTAYLRATMQPEPVRSAAPALFRDYVDARLALFGTASTLDERHPTEQRAAQIQDTLWHQAATVAQQSPTPITALYVSALNDVIDLDARRIEAWRNRVPVDIWALMAVLAVMTSLIVGYGQRHRAPLATFVPVLMVAISLSLIAELDTPASGLIQVSQQSMQMLSDDLHAHF